MFFRNQASASSAVEYAPAKKLALYHFDSCFYCMMVRRTIDKLGVDVEYRNIFDDPTYREELMAARGRTTVPVLRGYTENDDWWMPESRDIIRYLEEHYSES